MEKEFGKEHTHVWGLPWWLSGKESPCNAGDAGDMGSIPGSGRSSGGENGNPLQDSCQDSPLDREAWWATVHGVTKSQTELSDRAHMHNFASSKEQS